MNKNKKDLSIEQRIDIYGDDALLTTPETADFLQISRQTLYLWRSKNRVLKPNSPKLKTTTFGKNVRYRIGDIREFLHQRHSVKE